jgi:sarcosine oxidase, subunit beta
MGSEETVAVAVVGAGVTGLSIAHALLAAGVGPVRVYERSGIGAEASGVQPGGVRHQWSTRLNCLLVLESAAFYRELGDRLGVDRPPTLEPCGYVFVAHEEGTLERLGRDVAMQNALGIPTQLLDADSLTGVVADLQADGIRGGSFCADDGYFDRPQAVIEGFAEAVVREGGAIEIRDVRRLTKDGGGWQLDLDDGSAVTAEHVIVAAGTASAGLLAPLGFDVPIVAEAKHLFLSDPIQEVLLEPLVIAVDRHFAAKHLANGRVLASDLAATGDGPAAEEQWRRHVRACIDELLPRLTFVTLGLRVGGEYDVTPDHHPIVGPIGNEPGLWLAAGFSGHGFMIAPAIGRLVADALAHGRQDALLDALAFERFDGAELEPELQIV